MMTNQTETKTPTHIAYLVTPKEDSDESYWTKVGAMWEHSDKKGFNLSLNILGQDHVITIRNYKPKVEQT